VVIRIIDIINAFFMLAEIIHIINNKKVEILLSNLLIY